jgi:hypothetical protein
MFFDSGGCMWSLRGPPLLSFLHWCIRVHIMEIKLVPRSLVSTCAEVTFLWQDVLAVQLLCSLCNSIIHNKPWNTIYTNMRSAEYPIALIFRTKTKEVLYWAIGSQRTQALSKRSKSNVWLSCNFSFNFGALSCTTISKSAASWPVSI